jgi:hypothetical protein
VEEAITAKHDLNQTVMSTDDEYALIHLAVMNDHLDSLQRLLNTGDVQVDKSTATQGRSALFMAAEFGRAHALALLLEHAPALNAPAGDGQTALFVAAAAGHVGIVDLLRTHGASEDMKWMGLRPEDVERPSEVEREQERRESVAVGRKTTERPQLGHYDTYDSSDESDVDSESGIPGPVPLPNPISS